jgi:hypothetical protein
MPPDKPFFIAAFWGHGINSLHSQISASDCGESMQFDLAAFYLSTGESSICGLQEHSVRGLK